MRLRTKIALLTTFVAISVTTLILIPIRMVVVNTLRQEIEKRAESIAGTLSERIADSVLLGNSFKTSRALNDVIKREKDIEYIFVTDEDGRMFAHTFKDGYPPDILSWNPLRGRRMNIQLLETERGNIRDVGINIFEGMNAELHIGMREDSLRNAHMRMRIITIPIIIFVIILGIIASFLFSRRITEPLNRFVNFTKVLARGEFGSRIDFESKDEIGELAESFNKLSMELKKTKEKMEEAYTYTHLLHTEKLSSIGQISAGLAHELKNPVTALKMLFQAFREQPEMTEEDIEVITNEIEKIDGILTRFLSFVKQKGFTLSPVRIDSIIEHVLDLASFDIRNHRIVVHKDMLNHLPPVKADGPLLEQVFLNLLLNSIEAMPDGGEIRISGRADEEFVEVMIWDKGKGIPSDIRTKVFEPFFTTKSNGTGLGLSIAYNIVKEHGGRLFFDSNEGEGTVFTVRLPRASEPSEALEPKGAV
jgi:signal transduction histidine kinase